MAAIKSRQGSPLAVVTVAARTASGALQASDVRVKMVYAPVALADIFRIQGNIASNVSSCGSEGVGVVEEVGSAVKGLKKGDHVVPGSAELGTWASTLVASEKDLLSVPKDLDAQQAALLGSSAATALRVLSDVSTLSKGDCIILNGAETPLGESLIQIAKAKGIMTISVTGATNIKEAETRLKSFGSSVVVPDAFASSSAFRKVCIDAKPKLAVHCSNNSSTATDLARALAPGGVLVAVLGASPVTVPSSILIERGICIRGFAMNPSTVKDTFAELVGLAKSGALKQTISSTTSLNDIQSAMSSVASRSAGNILLKF